MFRFESMNGKVYDVLSYDNERALTLLYEVNDSMENTYLVVENMKNNGLIWAKEHSFTNYKEAHNYFVIEVYNALDYKEQFRNVLKQEETNLLEVKQEIEKVLDNNPHVNYTITLTNIDNLKESYQCYGYHSFDMAIQEANKKLDEHSSNYPFRAVLNVTTYEQLHPTFGTPIDEKVVYTKDISSLLFENSSIDLTQMKQDTFLIEDIKKEQKKGLSHIKDLGTTSQISSDNEVKKHEQER